MRASWALVFVLACGGPVASSGIGDLLDQDVVARARVSAPDLVAEAESAAADARDAERSGDSEAASDHATRARLLLEAALVEAERIALDEERLEAETRAEGHAAIAARIEGERAARAAEEARGRAASLARREAARAFATAETDENRRLRRRSGAVAVAHRQASRALLERASLLAAAARALGAEPDTVNALEERILAASAIVDPTEAMHAADQAHQDAMQLLGAARAEAPVTAEMRRGLLSMLEERELEASASADGVIVLVEPSRAPVLAQVLLAHPQGPVVVSGARLETRRFADALVAAGMSAERVAVHADGGELRVLVTGYGDATE